MNKYVQAFLAVLTMVFALVQTTTAAPTVTLSSMAKSGYLLANGNWSSKSPVLQSDLFVSYQNGIWLDFWNSEGLTSNMDSGYDDEFDYGFGWAGKLGQSGVSLDTGLYYFDIWSPTGMQFGGNDLLEYYAEITPVNGLSMSAALATPITITPFARVETLRDMGSGSDVNFESLTYMGAKLDAQMDEKQFLKAKVYTVYDPGIAGAQAGWSLFYEEQLNVKVTERFTFTPLWIKLVHKFQEGHGRIVGGFGIAYAL